MLVNKDITQDDAKQVYLRDAKSVWPHLLNILKCIDKNISS